MWTNYFQHMDQQHDVMNTVMNPWVPYKPGNFLTERLSPYQELRSIRLRNWWLQWIDNKQYEILVTILFTRRIKCNQNFCHYLIPANQITNETRPKTVTIQETFTFQGGSQDKAVQNTFQMLGLFFLTSVTPEKANEIYEYSTDKQVQR